MPPDSAEAAGLASPGSSEGSAGESVAHREGSASGASTSVGEGDESLASALVLSGEEAELVATEALAAARVLAEPQRSEATRLAEVARSGEVPAELMGILARIATASLQGGRARRLYRAEGERVLNRLLLRTPAGRAMQEQVDALNKALGPLAGRRLEEARVAMRSPGSFTLNLRSEGFAVTLAFKPDGVTLESLSA